MGKVVLDTTMSLDGFIAGPNISSKQPLGEGDLRLHNWLFKSDSAINAQVIGETMETTGAIILGKRTYVDAIDDAWGGVSPFQVTAFVFSKDVPVSAKAGFVFVSDGIESALKQAKAVAGDKSVWIMGGANVM